MTFLGTCQRGYAAAMVSKDLNLNPIQRVERVRDILGDDIDDMFVFEYLRSHGAIDTLYRVVGEARVSAARQNVIHWVINSPVSSPRKRKRDT
jgi:hypothetical protein